MKGYEYIKKAILGSVVSAVVVFGAAATADSRSGPDNYLKWQSAKARAEMRYRAYLATGRSSDFRKWKKDEARVTRRYNRLQRAGISIDDSMTNDLASRTTTEIPISNTIEDMNTSDMDQSTVNTSDMASTIDKKDTVDVNSTDETMAEQSKTTETSNTEIPVSPPPIVSDTPEDPVVTDTNQNGEITPPINNPEPVESTTTIDTTEPVMSTTTVDTSDVTVTPEPVLTPRAEKARDVLTEGYMYGHKQGQKDQKHGHKYNETSHMSFSAFVENRPDISHKYKMYYEDGYKKGYQDGYNNTTLYGERTETGYSVNSSVLDTVVDSSL